ncbi:TBC1 domain family member 16-like isoform X1 [Lytechinus variegatus]|uniref:TBC1 domain family member 16-like isoform X1 n=1 Tax=Lytechinus variegatus TaxID=7654 RepID=UPI001BB0FE65|nr:TBC1 domain family member 16-like isoform X1 [Lytechinus variegatus]XP_041473451.1 TBC1 domain family member 16-like isoform X1 [Lytechinus variegatus]
MAYLLKRFSDFLGISDPEYVRAPPLDGEIIFCKNNVCVHPPSVLSTTVEHHPGYLTIRAQRVSERQTSLVLTWIPNTSLNQRKRSSCSTSSPARVTYVDIRKQIALRNEAQLDNVSGDSLSILSKEEEAVRENACKEKTKESCRNESPQGSIQSFQDSGIGEGERQKMGKDCGVDGTPGNEACNKNDPDNKTVEGHKDEASSESDEMSTEQRLAALLNSPGDNHSPVGRPINLELQTKMKVHPPKDDEDKDSVSSSDSDDSETFNNILERLSNDVLPRQMSRRSSSTTPTTSNQDPSSLPSTPSPDESFDPFVPLYSLHSSSTCSPEIHPSPIATHNLTFPENSVCYRGKVICPGSPASAPARDQVCGVFSVDLCQMRSLRIFFADEECTNGQMVIASRESQYKILHFHHGGLDKMTEVFDHWKNCIKLHNQSLDNDDGTSHYLRKFNIIQSSMKPEDCHPEEGLFSELNDELWFNYINDRGQIEDIFRLRKVVFFGGVDEYLRRDVWPFLLGFFAFDSTTEERNALRGQKRLEYEEIQKERLEMTEDQMKMFYRNVQSTVDKDVVRTDRTHPYFKGEKNPNVDIMRNILLNFATYQPSMGYSQGMSDLLAPILAELQDESDAFWCFVSLMKNVIFVSSPKDEDMEMQLTYLLELIKLMLPEFWDHLIQIDDAMELLFCHRWILLCFKREFSEPEALRMWESCWAHYQTDYFHLFICLAIIAIYGDDVVQQSLPADDMLLHFSNLAMQMNGDIVLKKARSLLHQFRTLVRIPCTLDKLCRTCEPGMWDSGHSPVVECVGIHEAGYNCPHISSHRKKRFQMFKR